MIRTAFLAIVLGACALPVAKTELQHHSALQVHSVDHVSRANNRIKYSAPSSILTYGYGLDTTHFLAGNGSEGIYPTNSMIQGADGNLYGTTDAGGNGNGGVFYKVVTTGSVGNTSSTYTVLHHFGDGSVLNDGSGCHGKLVQDASGYILGTCVHSDTGDAVVYRINPTNGAVTIIHNFLGNLSGNDGSDPRSGLVRDPVTGNIYGTTRVGYGTATYGTIFKLTPSGGSYTYSIIYNFGTGGGTVGYPESITLGTDGKLYGTNGNAIWRYNLSTNTFTKLKDLPAGTLTGYGVGITQVPTAFTTGGRMEFWGVAGDGGTNDCYGTDDCGVIYKIVDTSSAGSGKFAYTMMHNFNDGTNEGYGPVGDLVFATDIQNYSLDAGGAFYGITGSGGLSGSGSIFRIDLSGTFWDIPKDVGINGGFPGDGPWGLIKGSISGTPVLWGGSVSSGSSNNNNGWLWHVFGW